MKQQVDMDRVRRAMAKTGAEARAAWEFQVAARNEIHVSLGGMICTATMVTGLPCTHMATSLLLEGPRCQHHGGGPLRDENGHPANPPWKGRAPTQLVLAVDPHHGGPCTCDWTNKATWTAATLRHRPLPVPDQQRYGPSRTTDASGAIAFAEEAGGSTALCTTCGWEIWTAARDAASKRARTHKCRGGDRCLLCGSGTRLEDDHCPHWQPKDAR